MHFLSPHRRRAVRPRPVGAYALAPQFAGEVQLVVRDDRRVLFASRSITATLGHDDGAARKLRLDDLVDAEDREGLDALWSEVVARPGARVEGELRFRHADGAVRRCEVKIENRVDDRSVAAVVVALRDVTDQRHAELALQQGTARLRTLAGALSEVILTVDETLAIKVIGASVTTTYGYARRDLIGRPLVDLLHPADRFAAMVDIEQALAGRPTDSVVVRLRHAEGHWVPTDLSVRDLRDDELIGAVSITLRDVTGRVVAERERDRLNAIMAATSDIVTMVGRDGRLTYANPAAVDFLSLAPGAGRLSNFPDWARRRYREEALPELLETGTWQGELAVVKDGREVPLSCVLVAHLDEDGRIESISAISRDISRRKSFENQLRHQATHDHLTGLSNRAMLMDRLEMALARTARLSTGVAVLFCDLDRFKVFNDSLGHGVGDEVLQHVAGRLAESVRPGDTVARLGGDEFVLVCSDLGSPRDAVVLADRIRAAVRRPIAVADSELVVTLSMGIAYDDHGTSSPQTLLRDADTAMYRAKARGRDRVEVFDDALRRRALDRLDTESGLRKAVDEGRLVVHYQPVIDLRDDHVSGFEALMRWDHPERGLLAPGDFMAVAEETGLIVPLGRHLFAEACHQTVAWQRDHGDPDLGVFVNFSASQLGHPSVVSDIALVLEESGIEPGCVQIEVTEHALLDDEDVAVSQIAALKDLGLKIVIDDFGTGYSSLTYLRRFPVDLLKVDRSFVSGLVDGAGDAAIVRGVIDLAHRLGLTAVAEGVESDEQMALLRELGCERAQGYLLGRPAPSPAQTAFLASRPAPERTLRPAGRRRTGAA